MLPVPSGNRWPYSFCPTVAFCALSSSPNRRWLRLVLLCNPPPVSVRRDLPQQLDSLLPQPKPFHPARGPLLPAELVDTITVPLHFLADSDHLCPFTNPATERMKLGIQSCPQAAHRPPGSCRGSTAGAW